MPSSLNPTRRDPTQQAAAGRSQPAPPPPDRSPHLPPDRSPHLPPDRSPHLRRPIDNAAPPGALVRPLAGAVRGLLEAAPPAAVGTPGGAAEPVPVAPGSLGSWFDDCDEAVEA
jgi:hypothetical protein